MHSRGFIRSVSVIKDVLQIKIFMRIRDDNSSGQVFPPALYLSNYKEIKRSTCIQAQDKREEHMEEMIKRIKQHEVYIAEVS